MSKYKASLHIHSAEDKNESFKIKYNLYELIDYAKEKNFKILAITFHDNFGYRKEFADYAKSKGILLIPGIESAIYDKDKKRKAHILILNCNKEAEKIKTFADLKQYKDKHPEVFTIAAHPFFGANMSIGEERLRKYINLIDGIENSWLYTKLINKNKRAQIIAKELNKPYIATADLHSLRYMDKDYTVINSSKLETEEILKSLRNFKYKNVSKPKTLLSLIKALFLTYF